MKRALSAAEAKCPTGDPSPRHHSTATRTTRAKAMRPRAGGSGASRLLDEDHVRPELQREAAARFRDNPQVGALLLETPAQQQEAALEVVLPLRQVQRLVEPQLAVRELDAARRLRARQELPEDLRRQAADQVLAVDEDALVGRVVGDLAPRGPARRAGGAAALAAGAGSGAAASSPARRAPAAACSGSRSRGSCRAARSTVLSSSWKRYGFSLSMQSTPTSSPRTSSGTPSWLSGSAGPAARCGARAGRARLLGACWCTA